MNRGEAIGYALMCVGFVALLALMFEDFFK